MRKSILGEIEKLSDLITDLQFCRQVVTPKQGSRTLHPDGFLFVSAPGCIRNGKGPGSQPFTIVPTTWFLFGKPTDQAKATASGGCIGGALRSMELIPWPHEKKVLVLGRDDSGIGAPWLAFIPESELPSAEFLNSLPLEGEKS